MKNAIISSYMNDIVWGRKYEPRKTYEAALSYEVT